MIPIRTEISHVIDQMRWAAVSAGGGAQGVLFWQDASQKSSQSYSREHSSRLLQRCEEEAGGLKPHGPCMRPVQGKHSINSSSYLNTVCVNPPRKIRKFRCDSSPSGCGPCLRAREACKTTDRITGAAVERGHVERLERRIREVENRNRVLEACLVSAGIDLPPPDEFADPGTVPASEWNEVQGNAVHQGWGNQPDETDVAQNVASPQTSDHYVSSDDLAANIDLLRLPDFRDGLAANNYLGAASGNCFLSTIRGTSLNVLGMKIDLADYMSTDIDEPDPTTLMKTPVYNKSYHAFVHTAFGAHPQIGKVELPPEEEGRTYAQWYFRVVNPYLPILHRSSFFSLVSRRLSANRVKILTRSACIVLRP